MSKNNKNLLHQQLKKLEHIVKTKSLRKEFGEIVAVGNVDFVVKKGTIVGLVGPNGSGKTTLLKMICALTPPTRGNIEVFGFDVIKDKYILHANIGYVPQEDSLYDDLTVLDNIIFFSKLFDIDRKTLEKSKKKLYKSLGLQTLLHRVVGELSGGWKRRVAIACSLLHNPTLIVLDEPTVGLDTHIRTELWQFFRNMQKEGKTLLLTTHYMEEAENCDYVAIMHEGDIVAFGTPAELIKKVKRVRLVAKDVKRTRFDDVYLALTSKRNQK